MTDATTPADLYVPEHPVRFVTATSLFDGHDAAINIIRRLLQAQGAEVIHLGHHRSVAEVVEAVIEEDVQGVAVSSYQGGHLEYYCHLVDELRRVGMGHVRVYGGGGGVIVPAEVDELHRYGVARIFTPRDGQVLGLPAMVSSMIRACDVDLAATPIRALDDVIAGDRRALARLVTAVEMARLPDETLVQLRSLAASRQAPTLGITGTGGSGKSTLTDELVRRFRLDLEEKLRIAVLAIDPTRRRSGGALLGDRIRMNAIDGPAIAFRSLATRSSGAEVPEGLADIVAAYKIAGFDLVIVETPGIGQGDAAIVPYVDVPIYVMTAEFGAPSQLEKIDMLEFADAVAINKFERRGSEDAQRDVKRQLARTRGVAYSDADALPVFGTIASRFNDDGVTALYQYLRPRLVEYGLEVMGGRLPVEAGQTSSPRAAIVPSDRARYLGEITDAVRGYHGHTIRAAAAVRDVQHLAKAALLVEDPGIALAIDDARRRAEGAVDAADRQLLDGWPEARDAATDSRESLSGTRVHRVATPKFEDDGELLRWLRSENLPGSFPYTAGVFPLKRESEEPLRMFAGEGDAFRTNLRFHYLASAASATRLSTAFDSVTLYGFDPAEPPDIYGKVGNSGVSIATLDDMNELFRGFDLCDPTTSVSMTINGPAPTILAMFLNTVLHQAVSAHAAEHGRAPTAEESNAVRAMALASVRGTVQADILKEDQGQNTCIFSTEFALKMMGDVQEWFIANGVRNFYSVSISGYHIAEAGANPITQLAFTLANGFTYVEAYLARGMHIDDFAGTFSFFFSNGMDPEYTVIGRVARRIWAIAMRDRYGASERSQRLKYHVQTSGRSLHAQEIAFNDIRTTLQALCAIYDNCNSLHTNAYDEAITTPTEESVRRAVAIQLIINSEWGLAINENPLQGSFVVEELTDLVEAAVLDELERLSDRGGVLGAMETGYQRGRIQDESMLYESRKHDGSLPIVGVNTFRNPDGEGVPQVLELARSTDDEKRSQLRRLRAFQEAHADESPELVERLQQAVLANDNVFAVLMDAVRGCSLGEITAALFEVGGKYRRNV